MEVTINKEKLKIIMGKCDNETSTVDDAMRHIGDKDIGDMKNTFYYKLLLSYGIIEETE